MTVKPLWMLMKYARRNHISPPSDTRDPAKIQYAYKRKKEKKIFDKQLYTLWFKSLRPIRFFKFHFNSVRTTYIDQK